MWRRNEEGGEKIVATSLIRHETCQRITDKLTSAIETGMKANTYVYICWVETCKMQCDYAQTLGSLASEESRDELWPFADRTVAAVNKNRNVL